MKIRMSYVFGILMLLIYWGMGFCLLFTPVFDGSISSFWRNLMGGVFFIYGGFRLFRQLRTGRYS